MGEARARGTYEERKALAIQKRLATEAEATRLFNQLFPVKEELPQDAVKVDGDTLVMETNE